MARPFPRALPVPAQAEQQRLAMEEEAASERAAAAEAREQALEGERQR